jgi:glyoxalase family protein
VRIGVKGAGQVTATSFSVPSGSLGFWAHRLKESGLSVTPAPSRFDEESVVAADPSGLRIELVGADDDSRTPWTDKVDQARAVRGLHSVTMTIRDPQKTIEFMQDLLGYGVLAESGDRIRVGVNGGGPGRQIDLQVAPDAPGAVNGIGTVHHVAMAIADEETQLRLRAELVGRGHQVTPVMDRQYFRSIYFREPGGVLFEVATMQPGFLVDESLEALGRALRLPPWEEPNRADIEAGLVAVRY